MNLNGNEYFYITNLQGDIIELVDIDGNTVVKYKYDAWGNILSTKEYNADGTEKTELDIAKINPYTYRGYRYDSETNLYYLNSRYYNPQIGRFINADVLIGQTGDILGHNIYAYCQNNPIAYVDPTGYQLADPTKKGDGVEPLRPVWSSPYDLKYNEWYVHPMYTNDNAYKLQYESEYLDYDQYSYFLHYIGLGAASLAVGIIGYFTASLGWAIGGGALTVASGRLVVYDECGQLNAEVFKMKVFYSERYDATMVDVIYYDILSSKNSLEQSYKRITTYTLYFHGSLTESDLVKIRDKFN